MSASLLAASTGLRQGFRWRKALLSSFRLFSAPSSPTALEVASSSSSPPPPSAPLDGQQQHQPLLSIAIVGRPNVGKSTLFNRLTKSKQAIVTEVPGTTRDRKESKGLIGELEFNVMDTGGLDDRGAVCVDIQKHVYTAVQRSHLILFVVDAQEGLTALDSHFAKWLRKSKSMLTGVDDRKRDIVTTYRYKPCLHPVSSRSDPD